MVDGIVRGSTGYTDNWKGSLDVDENLNVDGNGVIDGTLVVGGTITVGNIINNGTVVGGYCRKVIDVPATTWTTGTNNNEVIDTGWDIPVGALVHRCYLIVGTIDASETVNVGTTGTNGTTCIEFLNAISITTGKTNYQNGYPTFTAGTGGNTDKYWANDCTLGTDLCDFIAGSDSAGKYGAFLPKSKYFPTGASLYYSGSAGMDAAAFKIVVEYTV
jgi:hypothetical protein